MRRMLWSLAASSALGVTLTGTWAQEASTFPAEPISRSSSSLGGADRSTYADLFGTAESRPFPNGQQSLPRAGSLSETRASDLFRRDVSPRTAARNEGVTGRQLEDQFQRVSGVQVDPNRDVVHAEFQRSPGQRDAIEQVRGPGIARDFPQTAAAPSAAPTAETPVFAAPAASPSFNSFRTNGTSRITESRLVQPISTTPTARGITQIGGTQPTQTSRGVTFTRSAPETRSTQPSAIRQVSASEAQVGPTANTSSRVVPAAVQTPAPAVDAMGAVAQTVSSGPQTPTVSLEWITHSGINVGQECKCSLLVKNTGIIAAREVEVHAQFPTSVRIASVEPQPAQSEAFLAWTFAELQPGQEHVIQLALVPSTPGKIDAQADVRFTGIASTSLTVSEPLIEVELSGPEKVLIGEPASQTVTVRNPGNGIATNVQVEAIIPVGLEHARGERLVMDVGSLNPGESRSVRLALAAVKGGQQIVQVQARADGDLVRNTTSEVVVVAPSLVTEIEGPGLRYLGRPAVYTLKVRNDGEINVENVRVMHKMPDGFEVLETDRGAQFDRSNRLVNWFVGRLGAGQNAEMKVTVRPDQIGTFTHFVRATSEHGAISDSQFTTNVEGTASLAMEIRDLDDPIEVGNETAYEIVVRNDGSASARSVSLVCEIPAGMDVLNAQGPVDSIKQRDLVTFNPVLELAPGNSVTYRVHIRGSVAGHHRLRAKLSSEGNPEALTEDEVTRFYGE